MLLLAAPPAPAGTAAAHPLHAATVTLQHDPAARRLIGSLRAFTDDFSAAAGGADSAIIARYVARRFRWLDPDGRPVSVAIGRPAADGPATVVPLTLHGLADLRRARVEVLVLSERFSDQVNVVRIRSASGERSLLFLPGDGPKPVDP